MTLTEFLLERISEDERRAHLALAGGPVARNGNGFQLRLRQAGALRRVVERFAPLEGESGILSTLASLTLLDLAAAYSDHPDYQWEWRP